MSKDWMVLAKRAAMALAFFVGLGAVAAVWPHDAIIHASQPDEAQLSPQAQIAAVTDLRAELAQMDPTVFRFAASFNPGLMAFDVDDADHLAGYENGGTAYGLTPQAAALLNASIPISHEPNPAAARFMLAGAAGGDRARALDCLTAAVYYEAATEPLEGQQAVAQVVINRVRNLAYPKTVCGVVFQGYERTTGCQFSFTCDGSLGRAPNPALWEKAKHVAEAALSGAVASRVGLATHYHTFWVAPYWAPSLTKVAQIGAHIFYRWPGALGTPAAFSDHYVGGEWDPTERVGPSIDIDTNAIQMVSYQKDIAAGPSLAPAAAEAGGQDAAASISETGAAAPELKLKAPPMIASLEPVRPPRPARLAMPATW